MKVALFDAFSGASGDMIVASLLGVSLDEKDLKEVVDQLSLDLSFKVEKVNKKGIVAKKVSVEDKEWERSFSEVLKLIDSSKLEEQVKKDAKNIFTLLAEAEAEVHGRDYRNAVFHEIGCDDAIFDIVCASIGLRRLIKEGYRIMAMPIKLGSGFVEMKHGKYPVPTPAVLNILKRSQLTAIFGGEGELLTPTGAAILTYFCEKFLNYPMVVEKVSYGAGSREVEIPNVLRLILGYSPISDSIAIVETTVDDVSGEIIGYVLNNLNALDVVAIPAIGKKSRPATIIKAITKLSNAEEVAYKLMQETGSLGVRIIPVYHRTIAEREVFDREVEVCGRKFIVRFKKSSIGTLKPEFEDVSKISKELGLPIIKVYRILGELNVDTERK